MNGFIKRGLLTVLVTGGFLALGAGVAHADDTTDGSDGILSGTQAILGVDQPITVGGNAVSIVGDSSSSGSSTGGGGSAGSGGTGGTSPSATTSGTDSVLGGTQGKIGLNAPVTIGGNAISVIGDSSSEGSSFAGQSGSGQAGSATTSGDDSIGGGSQVVGDVNAPITVSGNAISVIGDSSSEGSSTGGGSSSGSGAGGTATTDGSDGIASGSQVVAFAAAPVTAGGNAFSVIGDSSSTGSGASSPTTTGGSNAVTSGEDGVLGGTQLVAGANATSTVGGNAVSVIGDSTVTDGESTGDDDNDVGGETITAPGVVSPAGVGAVELLAATGSELLVPGLALAVLLLAAGVTFMTRTRTVRS